MSRSKTEVTIAATKRNVTRLKTPLVMTPHSVEMLILAISKPVARPSCQYHANTHRPGSQSQVGLDSSHVKVPERSGAARGLDRGGEPCLVQP